MGERERFSAFYFKDFRLFWLSQFISFSGTWMHSTAQGWLVYSMTGSPLYLGLVSAAGSLPVLLFTLLGGVFADRLAKRNLLLTTQTLSILPALAIGVLASSGLIKVWHVAALVAFLGTVNAFDIPARHTFLTEIVERGNILNAVALNSAAFNGARIIGPVIAGFTIANFGLPACFYLNALSFVPVLLALSRIKARGEIRTGGSLTRDLLEGVQFLRGQQGVWKAMLVVAFFSLLGIPFMTMLPVFAEEILGVGPKGLGFLAGSAGIGAFIAAVGLAFKGDIREKQRLMTLTSILFPALLIAFAQSKNYYLSLALLLGVGWALVSFLAIANTSIQLKAPDALRGRVMSVYALVFLGLAPIGNSLMGVLAEGLGTPTAVTLTSCLCLLASLGISWGLPAGRQA